MRQYLKVDGTVDIRFPDGKVRAAQPVDAAAIVKAGQAVFAAEGSAPSTKPKEAQIRELVSKLPGPDLQKTAELNGIRTEGLERKDVVDALAGVGDGFRTIDDAEAAPAAAADPAEEKPATKPKPARKPAAKPAGEGEG